MTSQKTLADNANVSPFKSNNGLRRLWYASLYSYRGLIAAWSNEAAIRQEMVLAVVLVPIALYLDIDAIRTILMIASILLVIIVELLNSAVEAAIDRIGLDYHELSGRAKDMGSAAVFLTLCLAVTTWVLALL